MHEIHSCLNKKGTGYNFVAFYGEILPSVSCGSTFLHEHFFNLFSDSSQKQYM
jgi:hypothetical protein